jgi:hypothetical protein
MEHVRECAGDFRQRWLRMPPVRVFVSSTHLDLDTARLMLCGYLSRSSFIDVQLAENQGIVDLEHGPLWGRLWAIVRRCDVFVVLIGHRWGSVASRLFTEKSWVDVEIGFASYGHRKKMIFADLRPLVDTGVFGPDPPDPRRYGDGFDRQCLQLVKWKQYRPIEIRRLQQFPDEVAGAIERAGRNIIARWLIAWTLCLVVCAGLAARVLLALLAS